MRHVNQIEKQLDTGNKTMFDKVIANKIIFKRNLKKSRINRFRKVLPYPIELSDFKEFKGVFYPSEFDVQELKLLLNSNKHDGITVVIWKLYMFFKLATNSGKWGIFIAKNEILDYTNIFDSGFYRAVNHLLKLKILDIYTIIHPQVVGNSAPQNIYYFNKTRVYELKNLGNLRYLKK